MTEEFKIGDKVYFKNENKYIEHLRGYSVNENIVLHLINNPGKAYEVCSVSSSFRVSEFKGLGSNNLLRECFQLGGILNDIKRESKVF